MPKDEKILRTATEPKVLVNTACEFAASPAAADQAILLRTLEDPGFLDRADPPAEADATGPKQMRVARVIRTLRDSPTPAVAQPTLIALTRNGSPFRAHPNRDWLLIYALVPVRPPPPPVIAFWDGQIDPNGVWPNDAMIAVCDNATDEAAALVERKLIGQQFDALEKDGWLKDPILRHRNDLPLLKACERMIARTLPAELRPALLEVLCDYRTDWYYSCDPPKPPPRALASRPALETMLRICIEAEANVPMSASLRLAEELTRKEVEALLK